MYIRRMRRMGLTSGLALAALLLLAWAGQARAQAPAPPASLAADEAVDTALGSLQDPVVQRALIPPGTQEGPSLFPPYRQQPPAAQEDLRLPSASLAKKKKKAQ
jgi:hypothetical protein